MISWIKRSNRLILFHFARAILKKLQFVRMQIEIRTAHKAILDQWSEHVWFVSGFRFFFLHVFLDQ